MASGVRRESVVGVRSARGIDPKALWRWPTKDASKVKNFCKHCSRPLLLFKIPLIGGGEVERWSHDDGGGEYSYACGLPGISVKVAEPVDEGVMAIRNEREEFDEVETD